MIRTIRHKLSMWLVASLAFTATGCSVFFSSPQMASYQIQQLDDSFVEVVINLEAPINTDLDIRLNNRYTLQLEFDWLLNINDAPVVTAETDRLSEDPQLTPWMMCKYRF